MYKLRDPARGDVVIFKSPKDKNVDYIKRVIGLPGETVTLIGGKYYINGKVLVENYETMHPLFGGSFLHENEPVTVPPGVYFVSGDNRPGSSDSREFGFIAKEDFIGQAFLRYWPVKMAGLIPHPVYPPFE